MYKYVIWYYPPNRAKDSYSIFETSEEKFFINELKRLVKNNIKYEIIKI